MADAALAETPIAGAGASGAAAAHGVRPALMWGGLGFVLGAMFWHIVGFWTFVADVVFTGHDGEAPVLVVRKNDVRSAPRNAAIAPATAPKSACIKLVLDRQSAVTRPEPCEAADAHLPHTGVGRRQDHAVAEARGTAFTPVRSSRVAHGD